MQYLIRVQKYYIFDLISQNDSHQGQILIIRAFFTFQETHLSVKMCLFSASNYEAYSLTSCSRQVVYVPLTALHPEFAKLIQTFIPVKNCFVRNAFGKHVDHSEQLMHVQVLHTKERGVGHSEKQSMCRIFPYNHLLMKDNDIWSQPDSLSQVLSCMDYFKLAHAINATIHMSTHYLICPWANS